MAGRNKMRMIKKECAHKVDPFADHEVDLLGDHQVDLFADHRMDLFGRSVTEGNILNNFSYEAYGIPTNSEGIPFNSLSIKDLPNLFVGASGIRYDTKTNLHYMRFRWFSGEQMRFISADLLMDLNRYAYVSGNPVRYIDVLGLQQSPDPYTRWFTNPYEYKVNVIDKAPMIDISFIFAGNPYQSPLINDEAMKEFWKHYPKSEKTMDFGRYTYKNEADFSFYGKPDDAYILTLGSKSVISMKKSTLSDLARGISIVYYTNESVCKGGLLDRIRIYTFKEKRRSPSWGAEAGFSASIGVANFIGKPNGDPRYTGDFETFSVGGGPSPISISFSESPDWVQNDISVGPGGGISYMTTVYEEVNLEPLRKLFRYKISTELCPRDYWEGEGPPL